MNIMSTFRFSRDCGIANSERACVRGHMCQHSSVLVKLQEATTCPSFLLPSSLSTSSMCRSREVSKER